MGHLRLSTRRSVPSQSREELALNYMRVPLDPSEPDRTRVPCRARAGVLGLCRDVAQE